MNNWLLGLDPTICDIRGKNSKDTDGGGSDLSAAESTELGQVILSVEKRRDAVRSVLIHRACGQPRTPWATTSPGSCCHGELGGCTHFHREEDGWIRGRRLGPCPHTHPDHFPADSKCLGKPTCMAWWRRRSVLTAGRATLGVPGRPYWLYWLFLQNNVPAGQLGPACLFPWPRSMSHFKSYFYSFPPAPRLRSGLCTLISLCPSAAGAVASRHRD